MLVTLNEIFEYADKHEIAVGAFNVPTLEAIRAVTQAAEELNLPVILQHAVGHDHFILMEEIAPLMLHYARNAKVPVCVHLDHGTTVEACEKAIGLGFTSVMYDGSAHDFEGNIENTKKVVALAKEKNVTVEAELGQMLNSSIAGGEGVIYTTPDYHYTEVDEAKTFVDKTGVTCLAVAIGTMHGIYLDPPTLKLDRIKEIRDEIKIPVVLHGGSGLSKEDYQTAVKNGVRKINYYTYMNKAAGEAVKEILSKDEEYVFFDEMALAAQDAMYHNLVNFMKILATK